MRESMEFDVVIVGAGPAGLSTACRLMQLANEQQQVLTVCVVEKGSEVGAHILSGAIVEPRALNELFPDWQEKGAPLNVEVSDEKVVLLSSQQKSHELANFLIPKPMLNHGNYIASLGNLCRWLAEQAEQLGVEIFPGFPASHVLYGDDGQVTGIGTGDMGINAQSEAKIGFTPGMDLLSKYTVFSEGCHGHLGKELIKKFDLRANKDPQHYGLGIKEIWNISPEKHQLGLVLHGTGWPLSESKTNGGFFLYHAEDNQVVVGLITDLNYDNPHLSPYDEFQRLKHHPTISQYLSEGTRISYGARAITKGGFNSLPKMSVPGALLIGCDAGTLNFAKIKGTHTAMKSGMIAAETLFDAIFSAQDDPELCHLDLTSFADNFQKSWAYEELYSSRNFGPALHKFGMVLGGAFNYIDQNIVKIPLTLHDTEADHSLLKPASACLKINYPKPDGVLSFDKSSSVYLSNTSHEEDQPCHLSLKNTKIPFTLNFPVYKEPALRYCPAGVYEIIKDQQGEMILQINAQNCLHCKTCDIKDPTQNIDWTPPEGGGGPNYPNM